MNAPIIMAVDPRLSLLARASAQYVLVERGLVEVEEAFGSIVPDALAIIFPIPENWAQACWDAPGWAEAAREYHRNRKLGMLK